MLERMRKLFGLWQHIGCARAFTDRDLHELGLTRAQIMSFVTMPADVPNRLGRMAALFGIPDEDLQANSVEYRELLEVCACCSHVGPCARLLASGSSALTDDAGFCPNLPTLSQRADHPG